MSTSRRRAALVRKGSPAAHALSLAQRTETLRGVYNRCRRRVDAVYGRDDPMLVLLLERYEKRLDELAVTARALEEHLLMHAPAPRDGTDDAWLCENPACRAPMYGRRAGATSCSNACRAEVHRLRAAGVLPPRMAAAGNAS